MSEPKSGLQFVAAPASGWCEPDTGVCHIDATDEAASTGAIDETDDVSDRPRTRSDEHRRRHSPSTR
jgi:hypothetical protein